MANENNLNRIFSNFNGTTAVVNSKKLKKLIDAGEIKGIINVQAGGKPKSNIKEK